VVFREPLDKRAYAVETQGGHDGTVEQVASHLPDGAFYHRDRGGGAHMKTAIVLASALLLCACAAVKPDSARAEWEHVSHPLAGPPFGPPSEEDALDQLNLMLHWQRGAWFAESGLGYKLADEGMYGPRLTFTSRVGREIRFTK